MDGEEEVGSGVYALSPSRTAKCWRELEREGGDALVPRQKAGGADYCPVWLCKHSVKIPMEKESRLSPPALPSLLGARWERQRLRTSLCGILHGCEKGVRDVAMALVQPGLVAARLFLCQWGRGVTTRTALLQPGEFLHGQFQ